MFLKYKGVLGMGIITNKKYELSNAFNNYLKIMDTYNFKNLMSLIIKKEEIKIDDIKKVFLLKSENKDLKDFARIDIIIKDNIGDSIISLCRLPNGYCDIMRKKYYLGVERYKNTMNCLNIVEIK